MKRFMTMVLALMISSAAQAEIIEVQSSSSFKETVKALKITLEFKGMTVFNEIDHAKGAEKIGWFLAPNTVLVFGNPKIGTKLMQCDNRIGVDLPMRMSVLQDLNKKVWVVFENPQGLAQRYDLSKCKTEVEKMARAMQDIASQATK